MNIIFDSLGALFGKSDPSATFAGLYDDIYVQQEHRWDCGIATSSMVLRWCKVVDASVLDMPLIWEAATPLWTIDLYVFLKKRGVSAIMSTSVKGIEPGHSDIPWYTDHMDNDRERVLVKFKLAEEEGWAIDDQMSTLDLAQVLNKEKQEDGEESVAIVLVNSNNLIPRVGVDQSKYSGHYILLLHYDEREDEFVFLDPAKASSNAKRVSSEALERSRQSKGTDHDLILCSRKRQELPNS